MIDAPSIPDLRTLRDLALWLGVPTSEMTWWIWGISPRKRYTEFEIEKRRGDEKRVIRAPAKPIKEMQRRVASMISAAQEPSAHAHGYVAGRSAITGAAEHQSQEWLFTSDIADFFPAINFGRVRGVFLSHPFEFSHEVAAALAQLSCHDNELPQGAPTSPGLANLVCRGLDKELGRLAASHRCHYTRYADDLSFSTSRTKFPSAIAARDDGATVLGAELKRIVNRNGFVLREDKSKLVHRSQRHRVTGVVVNTSPNVPREFLRGLRTLIHLWEVRGEDAAKAAFEREPYDRNLNPGVDGVGWKEVIRGRLQHVGYVRGWADPTYDRLASRLDRLDDGFKRKPRLLGEKRRVRLFTEGRSDVVLFRAAAKSFHANGEFTEIIPVFDPEFEPAGDHAALRECKLLAAAQQEVGCVGMFDCDDLGLVRKTFGNNTTRYLRHGVGLVLLAPPPGFTDARYCIEHLFGDAARTWSDTAGRRLYFADEFDPSSQQHRTLPLRTRSSLKKTLVVENVLDNDGNNVALSKTDFADLVAAGKDDFRQASFEGFRPTFERLAIISLQTELSVRGMVW